MNWEAGVIAVADLPAVWPLVAPMLAGAVAMSEGRYDLRALYASVSSGQSLLWVLHDEDGKLAASFTTREARYPRAAFLCVDFLGGDGVDQWVEQLNMVLTAYARDAKLNGVEMVGRLGWKRTLAPLGWRQNAVLLTKSIASEVEAG